jgi:hypothetical protein
LEGYNSFPEAPVQLKDALKKRGLNHDDDMSWAGNHSLQTQQVHDSGCYDLESHGENDTMQDSVGRDIYRRMSAALSDHNYTNGNLNFAQQQYFNGNNSVTTMSLDLQSFNGESSSVSVANSFSDLSSTLSNLEIDTTTGTSLSAIRYVQSKNGFVPPSSSPTSLADEAISTQPTSMEHSDNVASRNARPCYYYDHSSKSTLLEL